MEVLKKLPFQGMKHVLSQSCFVFASETLSCQRNKGVGFLLSKKAFIAVSLNVFDSNNTNYKIKSKIQTMVCLKRAYFQCATLKHSPNFNGSSLVKDSIVL